MTVDCNSRYVYADPFKGCSIAVAEAARNIVCSGGIPSAVTNCLNFGNPYNPEVYWQFVMAIKGMSEACLKFNTPVTGGNVSFYNQSVVKGNEVPVFPTPTIGMIGILESKDNIMTLDFKDEKDHIFLIGKNSDDISSSEYLFSFHNTKYSPAPYFNLDEEYDMQQLVINLINEQLVSSAHDVSEGGIFIALLESAMASGIGFSVITEENMRKDGWLYGEAQGRVIVSVSNQNLNEFIEMAAASGVDFSKIGETGGDNIVVDEDIYGSLEVYRSEYENAIAEKLTDE
jgi:phosphoribosylformylglycinamidine (FGAM) synthase-like enzyme